MTDILKDEVKIKKDVGAGIILRKNKEKDIDELLLIVRAEKDRWPFFHEIPRGKCNRGERLEDCVKREVKEETGLDVDPTLYVGKFKYIADNGKRESTQYNFICRMNDEEQEVKLSKEHDDHMWITTAGEANLHLMPECAEIVRKVLNPEISITSNPTRQKTGELVTNYLDFLYRRQKT